MIESMHGANKYVENLKQRASVEILLYSEATLFLLHSVQLYKGINTCVPTLFNDP
jgi:hypothetical protein